MESELYNNFKRHLKLRKILNTAPEWVEELISLKNRLNIEVEKIFNEHLYISCFYIDVFYNDEICISGKVLELHSSNFLMLNIKDSFESLLHPKLRNGEWEDYEKYETFIKIYILDYLGANDKINNL